MMRTRWSLLLLTVLLGEICLSTEATAGGPAEGRGTGLRPAAFRPLPLGRIKPAGWLRNQLKIQAEGLSGHLDEFWPDIKDSAWVGGKAEGWERVPYWLDGLVPLAYQLDDPVLQSKVKKFVDYILAHQQPDGWLGPVGDTAGHKPYDPWPLFPLFKALTQFQEATGDPRVVPALLKCARKINQVIEKTPLYSWARVRAADFAVSLYWLYDRTGETWLLDLARLAFTQSHDWRAMFEHFPFTARSQGNLGLESHGVNTGMALKYGGVRYLLTGDAKDRAAIFPMLELLDRYHGQATGTFTCDEHLAGRNPSQGTELCTVVEAMYSLETLLAIQGDPRLGDRLEKLAFNALPATFKKDMTAHQYDQQCNQVVCSREGEHVYVSNGPDSNLYGLEPNFGCCTANMHQGWPKLVSSLWMKTRTPGDEGLAAVAYAPCTIETTVKGKPVKVEVATEYPFRDTIRIAVTAPEQVTFPLRLRVPAWAEGAELAVPGVVLDSGGDSSKIEPNRHGQFAEVKATWNGTRTLTLRLPIPVRLHRGFNNAVAVVRGPLVYALKIGAEWKKIKDNPRFADWEVYPTTPWNYALEIDRARPEKSVAFEERPVGVSPFSPEGAGMIARVKARRLPGWRIEKGAAAPPPRSPVASESTWEEVTLVPYGSTDLRITEFPTLGAN